VKEVERERERDGQGQGEVGGEGVEEGENGEGQDLKEVEFEAVMPSRKVTSEAVDYEFVEAKRISATASIKSGSYQVDSKP